MKSTRELRLGIELILKMDASMRSAAKELTSRSPNSGERKLAEITAQNYGALQAALAELHQHDNADAVKAIKRLFSSEIILFRLLAINVLSTMSCPEAAKALASRLSFWSFASEEEKDLVKSLREVAAQAHCACCSKTLRPYPVPPGPWAGTLKEFAKLKIEPDHGLVCEACGAVICPVCSGKKATELLVAGFACTRCGAKPLTTIYRGAALKRAA